LALVHGRGIGVGTTDNPAGFGAGRYRDTAEFPMTSVVNLRIARKRAKRRKAEQEAAANRLTHGSSKTERNLERVRRDKALMRLDQHRIESGDEE
jgi:Domain of unknown function (DUF4169)